MVSNGGGLNSPNPRFGHRRSVPTLSFRHALLAAALCISMSSVLSLHFPRSIGSGPTGWSFMKSVASKTSPPATNQRSPPRLRRATWQHVNRCRRGRDADASSSPKGPPSRWPHPSRCGFAAASRAARAASAAISAVTATRRMFDARPLSANPPATDPSRMTTRRPTPRRRVARPNPLLLLLLLRRRERSFASSPSASRHVAHPGTSHASSHAGHASQTGASFAAAGTAPSGRRAAASEPPAGDARSVPEPSPGEPSRGVQRGVRARRRVVRTRGSPPGSRRARRDRWARPARGDPTPRDAPPRRGRYRGA